MFRTLFALAVAVFAVMAFSGEAKAQATYVEVCTRFGADYFYSPGTSTCVNARTGVTREDPSGALGQTETARKADAAEQGASAAAALSRPFVETGHSFAIAGDVAGANEFGAGSVGAAFRVNENLTVSGSGAYTDSGTTASRAGFNLSW
jgi:hypothetical protein